MIKVPMLTALSVCMLAVGEPAFRSLGLDTDKTIVTAAQVNGTWRSARNEFKILALGKNRLKVEFSGVHEYRSSVGPMANTGELSGIATIEAIIATLRPPETVEGCTITMTFKSGKMEVRQDGECGFGAGVYAGGTYRRVSSRKPRFTDE